MLRHVNISPARYDMLPYIQCNYSITFNLRSINYNNCVLKNLVVFGNIGVIMGGGFLSGGKRPIFFFFGLRKFVLFGYWVEEGEIK